MLHSTSDAYINTRLLALLRKERDTNNKYVVRRRFSGAEGDIIGCVFFFRFCGVVDFERQKDESLVLVLSSSSSSSSAWTKTRTSSVSSSSLSSSAMRMMLSSRTRVSGNGAHFLAIERTKSSSVSNNKNKRLLVVKKKSSARTREEWRECNNKCDERLEICSKTTQKSKGC